MPTPSFEDFVDTEAKIAASETVGPNSIEYDGTVERLKTDVKFVHACACIYVRTYPDWWVGADSSEVPA